jgi:hypothetical protein
MSCANETVRANSDPTAAVRSVVSKVVDFRSYTLGSNGGEQSHPLTAGEIPTITSTNSGITLGTAGAAVFVTTGTSGLGGNTSIQGSTQGSNGQVTSQQVFPTVSISAQGGSTSNNTGGAAHNNVQAEEKNDFIFRIMVDAVPSGDEARGVVRPTAQ